MQIFDLIIALKPRDIRGTTISHSTKNVFGAATPRAYERWPTCAIAVRDGQQLRTIAADRKLECETNYSLRGIDKHCQAMSDGDATASVSGLSLPNDMIMFGAITLYHGLT